MTAPAPHAPLDGKVLVCTGGGSGIGRATIDALVLAGASVVVLEIDEGKAELLASLGDCIEVVHGDATSSRDNAAAVSLALDRWGRVDGVASFVGIFDHYLALEEIGDERLDDAFTEIFDVNVKSALVTARAALPALRRTPGGSITLTLSTSSFYPGRGGILYVASKFALRGVVAELAHELAPDVRVNGVAPGGTLHTDLRGARSLGMAERRLDDKPGRAGELAHRTPLGVALTPAHHAGAYVFLASDAASGITGEIIRSDGGIGVR